MQVTKNLQTASIKLLHAVLDVASEQKEPFSYLTQYGIILVNKSGLIKEIDKKLAKLIIDNLGIKSSDWIQSFHKSWDKVATAPIEQLIAEQILHYFNTYGMESLGFDSLNYIPVEKIFIDLENAPSLESFTVVRIISEGELETEIRNLVCTIKSPNRDSIEYIKYLMCVVKDIDVDSIKSFELKIIYCDIHNKVPSDCQDFLRLAIYRASEGKLTTIVKDKKTIELLKVFVNSKYAESMFENADLKKLSESFYRFKPLFLAFKKNKKIASKINKIRRYAVNNHKPVSGFVVSNLMNLLAQNRKDDAIKVIEKADIRELVKLINFAKYEIDYETKGRDHIYNIRNGKVYVKIDVDGKETNIVRVSNLSWLYDYCKEKLKGLLNDVYKGKVFYIPENVEYVVPVSEKQMLDTIPYGTKIILPEDGKAICIGGHWVNQDRRIDLDFHLNSMSGSFGWNSGYRSNDNGILFSGDMTDAPIPNGAVEAFRISSSVKDIYFLSVNVYNTTGEIPFELLFTKDISSECYFKKNSDTMISSVINPENAIAPKINLKTHEKEEIIGFYNNKSFTLYGGELGGGHRVPKRDLMLNILNASYLRCISMMTMKEFIELGGGKVIDTKNEGLDYIDLSMNNLTSTTFFNFTK